MSADNIRLKQESMDQEGQQILEDINPITNTKSIDDSASGEKLYETLMRMWNAINNKLTRIVNSVNGRTGPVLLTSDDVGLGNVDNISYAEIKEWVLNTIREAFSNLCLRLYNDFSEVETIVASNDPAYANVPFYCDNGPNGDPRAHIGFFYWDPVTSRLEHMEKAIPTVARTDGSVYYISDESDTNIQPYGETDPRPLGELGVNIFHPEVYETIYVVNGETKAESGLKIDGSKIVGRLYYADGVYGNGEPDDGTAFLWFADPPRITGTWKGPEITILFDGVELRNDMDSNFKYHLKKSAAQSSADVAFPFKIGDLVLCNFKAYPSAHSASAVLYNGMDNRLMWRTPALGIVTSAPAFENNFNDPYVIDFKSLNQFPGWGLQYLKNHRDATRDIEGNILAVKVNASPDGMYNYSGLQVLADITNDSNPINQSEVFGTYQIGDIGTQYGSYGTNYETGQLLRMRFDVDGKLSNTIFYVKRADENDGHIMQMGVVYDPTVYDHYGIDKTGLGAKRDDFTYGPYESHSVNINGERSSFDAVIIGKATFTGTDPDVTFSDIVDGPGIGEGALLSVGSRPGSVLHTIGTYGSYVRPDEVSSEGFTSASGGTTDDTYAGLMITTDASICVNPNTLFGRWFDPDKPGTYTIDKNGNKVGITSKLVQNYTTSRTIPQMDRDPLTYGVLADNSPLSVNLRKEVQYFNYKTDDSYGTLAYRNLSGLQIVPFETDVNFESTRSKYHGNQSDKLNADYLFTPIPGAKKEQYGDVDAIDRWSIIRRIFAETRGTDGDHVPSGDILSGGLQINTGKYVEIDPSYTPLNPDTYYESGRLQVRTGRGFTEDYTYIMVGRKDRGALISTDEFPLIPNVNLNTLSDFDNVVIPDNDLFLDPYYYADHEALGDPDYFVPIDPVFTYSAVDMKPDDFVEGAIFYKKTTVASFISTNPLGWDEAELEALQNEKSGDTNIYYEYTITADDVAAVWDATVYFRKNANINGNVASYLKYGDIYWRVHSNRLGYKTDETLQLDRPSVLKSDVVLLTEEPADWADNYWQYLRKTTYTSGAYVFHFVNKSSTPEWQPDTYYKFDPEISEENKVGNAKIGVRSPVRKYEVGKVYKKNQLLESNGKIYITTKDYITIHDGASDGLKRRVKFDKMCGGTSTLNNTYSATIYKSQSVVQDMAAGYLSNRFAQDVVVDYEPGMQYPYGQFVQYEGKLYLVIKSYDDYTAQSIYEDIDAGYLSNAFNTAIRKVLYFRDTQGRSFTFDPSGTKETRRSENQMSISEQKRFKEYEYVKLGPGLKVTGGDVPIEVKCSKTDLRAYLLEEVERLSVAEEIMYARTLYPDWGASAESENDTADVIKGYYNAESDKFYADSAMTVEISGVVGKLYRDIPTNKDYTFDGTSWHELVPESTLLDANVTLQQILDFDDQFDEDLQQIKDYADGELIRNTALHEDRTVAELRAFKQTLDTIRINLEDPAIFFLGRKEYLLDDYRTLQNRIRKLVLSANTKVNKLELYQALIDYFELGTTTEATYSSIQAATQDFMLMNVAKLEWLFNDWAQLVYNADDTNASFIDSNSQNRICPWSNIECTCPYIEDCSKCPINPSITNRYDAYVIGTMTVNGIFTTYTNVYTEMSPTSTVSTKVPYGELVNLVTIPNNNEWMFARYGNNTGYISKNRTVLAANWNGSNLPATITNVKLNAFNVATSATNFGLILYTNPDSQPQAEIATVPNAQTYRYAPADGSGTNVFTVTLRQVPSDVETDGGYTAEWAHVVFYDKLNVDGETVVHTETVNDVPTSCDGYVKTNRMTIS